MSEAKISAALVAAYRAALPALADATAYEGRAFVPGDRAEWAQLTNLRAGTDVASLGEGGADEHLGVLQIDINVPENTGTAVLLARADTLRGYFVAGRRFTNSGQNVRINGADVSAIRSVESWLRISVSVNYSAHSIRPEV